MTRLVLPVSVLLLVMGAAACNDGSTDPGVRGIRVVEGETGSDTVLSVLPAALAVEIRDRSGHLVPGARAEFVALPPTPADSDRVDRGMYVCPVSQSVCAQFSGADYSVTLGTIDAADAAGIARARVQFGVVAGPAVIEVSVPELGIRRTLQFTTRPGSLARVVPSVRDTGLYVGASFVLGARATDRFGNSRTEPVTMSALTPTVLSLTSSRLTALAIGRGRVLLRSGTVTDTAFVSIPPPGRLVAFGWAPDRSTQSQLTLVNTDGSARRVILTTPGDNGNALPVWTPDGRQIVFQEALGAPFRELLYVTDTLGQRRTLLASVADFPLSIQPAFSANGAALYFYGSNQSTGKLGIYRATPDGTATTFLFAGVQPAPSPDGSRVAYVSGSTLYVRDVARGKSRSIAPHPQLPRWSPAGDLIAFVSYDGVSELRVVDSDGSGLRTVAPGFRGAGISWSPDGTWLVSARYGGGLELHRLADGVRIPVPGTADLGQPSWRP